METNSIIATRQLTRTYGQRTVVENLQLSVPQGVVYGFLGPNGAGKTTTIRMLLGLIRPSGGEIDLFGQPFHLGDWRRLQKVGALVESPSLYPNLTGRENLEVIRRMLDLPVQNLSQALETVQLSRDANRLVRQYSLGMQQRLAIAMALINQPTLLILDEPTNGLDPAGIHEIRAMIRDMPTTRGVTVFLSSHLLTEVELMATHVGIIQSGQLRYQGLLSDLKTRWGSTLYIETDRLEDAHTLLTGLGWQSRIEDHTLQIRNANETSAGEIHQLLVQRGIGIRQFYLRQPGLEEMFLDMTRRDGES